MSRKRSASLSGMSSLGVSHIRTIHRPARKPTHAAYDLIRWSATELPRGIHRTVLSSLRPDPGRLGALLPAPFHHRVHLHGRTGRYRALVQLPPLLFPLLLVPGRPVPGARSPAGVLLLSGQPYLDGRRRHAVPQTRLASVRGRHASRSLVL